MTITIINLLVKIFILTAFGFLCKKTGLINDDTQKGINKLLVRAILPVTIFMSSQNDYSSELAGNMLITFIIVSLFYMFSLVFTTFVGKAMKLEDKKRSIFVTMITFGNVGFIGFPIALELYGNEGVLYTVVYNMVFQLLFYTYGAALISGDKSNMRLSVIFKTPVTIASFACVFLFLAQIKIPEMIAAPLDIIGAMTTPISLILVGCSLAGAKLRELVTDKLSYVVSFFKMIFMPALMMIVLMLLKLPAVLAGTCAVLTALPAGSTNVIYAEEYDCEPQFASRTVIQTMIIMIVTLPLCIFLLTLYHV